MNLDPEELIERKRDWIEKKQRKFDELRSRVPDRTVEEGANWPYKGKKYSLQGDNDRKSKIEDRKIKLSEQEVERNGIRDTLEDLYRGGSTEVHRGNGSRSTPRNQASSTTPSASRTKKPSGGAVPRRTTSISTDL
jgi:hypothetical protein